MDAAGSGGPDQNFGADEELGMAPVDLEQTMGSLSPEWGNDTVSRRFYRHRYSFSSWEKTSGYMARCSVSFVCAYLLTIAVARDDAAV